MFYRIPYLSKKPKTELVIRQCSPPAPAPPKPTPKPEIPPTKTIKITLNDGRICLHRGIHYFSPVRDQEFFELGTLVDYTEYWDTGASWGPGIPRQRWSPTRVTQAGYKTSQIVSYEWINDQ